MRKNRKITNYLDEVSFQISLICPLASVNALDMGYGRGNRLNALEAFYRAPMNSRQANYAFDAVEGVSDAFPNSSAPVYILSIPR